MPLSNRSVNAAAVSGALALVIGGGLVGLGGHADAASPSDGTVSTAQPSVSWTGAPLAPSNPSQLLLGTAVCDPAPATALCDDFALHVADAPAGADLLVSVAGQSGGDYDAYVLDQDGTIIASGENAGPESITLPAAPGDYTVRVMAFEQVADGFDGSAALVSGGGTPTPSPSPTATPTPPPAGSGDFTTYGAPESFSDAHDAGEPSIGNSFATGATMYQASLSTYKVDFDDTTTPAKATWSDVSANAGNGCPQGSTVSLDPILYTDHQTGRTFESQLTGVDSFTCWTDDDGATWNPSEGGGIPSGVDHQTLGGGPFSADDPVGPVTDYPDTVYYCSQDIATAFCASSHDGGTTFGPGVPAWTAADCGGLHGHVKVAPDGTAYVPNKDCGGGPAVVASTDGGLTWATHPIPGPTASDADPSVGIGRNGTVYAAYVDGATGRPGVAVSADQGATWQHVQSLGAEFGINNAVFPAAVAGDDDRASVAFIGTPTAGDYQAKSFAGVWHLYVATTDDGGATWSTVDATPGDPVQRGSICTGGTTCGQDRNLLDFIDATIDDHGRVLVGFADGCTGACVTNPAVNTYDAYATIARQSAGRTLFSKYDPATAPASAPPSTTSSSTSSTPTSTSTTASSTPTGTPTSAPAVSDAAVRLVSVRRHGERLVGRVRISNLGDTDLTGVAYRLSDRGHRVRQGTVDLAAGDSVVRTVRWRPSRPGARQPVVAVVDPAGLIAESDERNNRDRRVLAPAHGG